MISKFDVDLWKQSDIFLRLEFILKELRQKLVDDISTGKTLIPHRTEIETAKIVGMLNVVNLILEAELYDREEIVNDE